MGNNIKRPGQPGNFALSIHNVKQFPVGNDFTAAADKFNMVFVSVLAGEQGRAEAEMEAYEIEMLAENREFQFRCAILETGCPKAQARVTTKTSGWSFVTALSRDTCANGCHCKGR